MASGQKTHFVPTARDEAGKKVSSQQKNEDLGSETETAERAREISKSEHPIFLGGSTRLQDTMEVKWFHIRSQRGNWNQSLQLLTKKGQTPTFSFPVKKSQFLQKCYRKIPTTKNTGVVMKPDIQICLSVFFMPIFSSSCSHSQRGPHNVIGAASQCLASV